MEINIDLDKDVYDKLCMALKLNNEDINEAVDKCIRGYIAKTFEKISQEINPKISAEKNKEEKDYYGKAIQRIPVWALKPNQYNHKIIKAYFKAMDIDGEATLSRMESLCSDKGHSELYVPTFKNNYAQMKLDAAKTHGKVFEDDGNVVWLWSEVKDIVLQYKTSFYSDSAEQ